MNPTETTTPAPAAPAAPAHAATGAAPATADAPKLGAVTEQDLAALSARSGDAPFLAKRRETAWAFCEKTPFPSRLEELWRRTDISSLKWDALTAFRAPHPAVDSVAALPEHLREAIGPEAERSAVLVQVDSETVYAERSPQFAKEGITFAPLAEAARLQPALVERWLGATIRADESRFTALNAALRTGGAFLHVPAGVQVERPIRIVLSRQTPDVAQFPHIVVVLEKGARATVIEEYLSAGEPGTGVCVGVTEHVVGENADLDVATFQRWGTNVYHFGAARVRVGKDARFHWTVTELGGKLRKADFEMFCEGEGAEAKLSGCYFGDATQHFDFHTFQNHKIGHSVSDLLFKGALRGRARTIYQGLIKIHRDAQRSDAYQANRNLILSDKARADSIPSLEIEANDVRCTHGATVGQVDDEQLFYLMARGLTRHDAEKLIIEGFFTPVLERIPSESLRALVTAAVERKAAG
ncbi:MAG TPA: Fe-S cluster assembly protein SufD [Candidatus Eisenbacteria bacterium]|nr:Fe-S cluster assembly protein SufD [Candidatus Eisenbacteria bacterium]